MKRESEIETDTNIHTDTDINKKGRSPLFRRQFNRQNPFEINTPRSMSKHSFNVILNEALKKL